MNAKFFFTTSCTSVFETCFIVGSLSQLVTETHRIMKEVIDEVEPTEVVKELQKKSYRDLSCPSDL